VKVLLISTLYPPNLCGGAEKVAHRLAAALIHDGHQVVVVTTQPSGPARQEVVDGAMVYYLPVKNLYHPLEPSEPGPIAKTLWRVIDSHNFFTIPQLTRVIGREQPDVVNTHNIVGFSVAAWSAVRRLDIPLIHTLHDQYLLCHRSTMYKSERNCKLRCLDCRILTLPRKSASSAVDGVIGVSKFILDRHVQFGYFEGSIPKVIYNRGFSHQVNEPVRAEHRRPFRFGYLGQIIPSKGVRDLIAAFKGANLPSAELLIAGNADSPYGVELRRTTLTEPNVHWLGFVDPDLFLRSIDLLVVPSKWHDTAPLVILEAFNHGIPVLGSLRGGIPELIDPATGWLFDPEQESALLQSLTQCYRSQDRLAVMSAACLARTRGIHDTKWSAEYVSAYQSVISKRRPHSAIRVVSN
jgi:glycosyltransferase involved in cell wall biosynthesis